MLTPCILPKGRHWRNNSHKNESSVIVGRLPCNCCKWRSNCVGLRVPSSSEVNNNWSFFSSEAVVNWVLRVLFGSSLGGLTNKSRTSTATSGAKEDTTCWNLDCWGVMHLHANCASTWVNTTSRDQQARMAAILKLLTWQIFQVVFFWIRMLKWWAGFRKLKNPEASWGCRNDSYWNPKSGSGSPIVVGCYVASY